MLTPQLILPIAPELIVDLFAGGGGASTGIEQATGRHPDIAINHDPEAVSLHAANHPQTRHYVSDVFEVCPRTVTAGQPIGLLWASPDCKHFSKAKGGKPVSKKIRSLAWVVVKWASIEETRRPRVICLENVEEFQTWGPLGRDQLPCPRRKGRTFRRWICALQRLGYVVEWKELRACDYGAPTIRKRLFLVARRDGAPITWPAPTHGAPDSPPVRQRKLKPWRTAADCIDWSIPCPSIFGRARPLAEATLRRIAKGIFRYVIDAAEPFIVPLTHQGGDRVEAISNTFNTITGAHRGEKALVVPTLAPLVLTNTTGHPGAAVDEPLRTQTTGTHHALVTAFLAKHFTGVVGSDLAEPIGTVTSIDHHSLVAATLVGVGARAGQSRPRGIEEPLATVTAKADVALVAANLIHMGHGEGADGSKRFSHGIRDVAAPLNTITAQGAAAGVVQAFLVAYYGSDEDGQALQQPLRTVPTRDRFGLVMVKGEPYAIVDIGLRMLQPHELYAAQGFPATYQHATGADGRPLTKTAQVRMCGNSVCPPLARAIVAANYAEPTTLQKAA